MAVPMEVDDMDDKIALILAPPQDESSYLTALKALADQSRDDLSIRSRLGRADVLEALVQRLLGLPACHPSHYNLDYEKQTLRCIGNACAMNQDAIRTISTLGIDWFTRYTVQSCPQELQILSTAVLYNITAADFSGEDDSEEQENPALKVCHTAGIHVWLIGCLAKPQYHAAAIDGIDGLVDMLFWISSSAAAEGSEKGLLTQTITTLCTKMQHYCQSTPAETLGTLIESVVTLLRPEKARLANGPYSIGLLDLLVSLNERIEAIRDKQLRSMADDLAVLVPQSSNLTWLLSDIASELTFGTTSKLKTPLVERSLSILVLPSGSERSERIQIAASLVLGNALLNMPEEVTVMLLRDTELSTNAVDVLLQPSTSPDLLHAGSGLLTMLCRPRASREEVGDTEGIVFVVEKLCKHQVPQIREAGVRLLRALGRDCQRNQQKLSAIVQAVGNAQPEMQQQQQQQLEAAP